MKKVIAILAALALVLVVFAACTGNTDDNTTTDPVGTTEEVKADLSDLKIGFIFLHDENTTYDLNFINAVKDAQKELGLTDDQVIIKTNIPEGSECYEAAVELADDFDCDIVFADSFGHEDYMIQAAKEYPDVEFWDATGTKAHTEKLDNFHNAFASIYEGRFLAGVVAGMKLNEMIADGKITADQAKIGYVGAMPYAEVKSGMTSFYLGARYICESATIEVKYTNSWYDETLEMEYANALINDGCVLISQHADSMGAPNACEAKNVPNVSYNGSTNAACPETFLISSRINWAPYYEYIINCVANDEAIAADWSGTIETGSVELSELGKNVAEGTAEKLEEVKNLIVKGELEVFDTATFTVKGEAITSYLADVDTDAAFTGDTEVVEDGAFKESKYRSAPYFDLDIDGVTTK